ncbi:MAG: septum formation protein Maf [Spirochaetaceae bacterium]|nr:septum formation protein Maf [Spirochaetaceae bacterium]
MFDLLLASGSPRRREILRDLAGDLGLRFSLLSPDVDESLRDDLPPPERVLALAGDKARAALARPEAAAFRWILAADTLVCLPGLPPAGGELVLGKPDGRAGAEAMIRALSGREHLVHTGLLLLDRATGREVAARSDSSVRFATLEEEEIASYLDSGDWEGVAGAYKIQGLAARYIERIDGSWSGIVGLPIRELYGILRRAGLVPLPAREA